MIEVAMRDGRRSVINEGRIFVATASGERIEIWSGDGELPMVFDAKDVDVRGLWEAIRTAMAGKGNVVVVGKPVLPGEIDRA